MKKYPLFKVHISSLDAIANINNVFESGYINEGIQVTQLTEQLQHYLKCQNLILTNSCTSALTLALKLSNVNPGDNVISTPMTCVATNTNICNANANIIWADVDKNSGMLDPTDVLKKLRTNSNVKAVIAVAWAGTPPELELIKMYCHQYGAKLILDAAHAFGAEYHEKPIHAWADYTCYSFQAIKHFTTGDGGALISNNENDYKRSKALKWFGLDRDHSKDEKGDWKGQQWDVDIVEAGYKFNMNNVAAAIGLSQMSFIDKLLQKHRDNASIYDKNFLNQKMVSPVLKPANSISSYWVYTMLLDKHANITRDELLQKLNQEGIMAGIVHVPNDTYTAFATYKSNLPGVREFSTYQFSLPCGWWLTDDDIEHIANRVKELIV